MSDDLLVFYAFNHSKVLIFDTTKESPADLQELTSVLSHYNISFQVLSKFGDVVKLIAKKINENKSYYVEMEKKILNQAFFGGKITTLLEVFLGLPNDSSLKKRLDDVFKESSECFICMDKDSEIVFQCAHQMCNQCCSALEKQECPFCRDMITSKMSKEQFTKLKQEAEEKQKLEDERIKKEINDKTLDGTFDYNNYREYYDRQSEHKQKFPTLGLVKDCKTFLAKRLKSLLLSKGSLSPKDREEITVLVNYFHETVWQEFTNTKISSEEVVVQVVTSLFKKLVRFDKNTQITPEELSWIQKLEDYLCSPNKILRFLAVLNGKEPKPDQKILMKFPNRIKKFIVYLLDRCGETDRTYSELMLHRPIWKLISKSFHAGDKTKFGKYRTAQKLIAWIRTNESAPIKSKLSTMEKFFRQKNKKIFDFFLHNPGLFYRNARRATVTFSGHSGWKEFIPEIVKQLKTDQLLQLSYVLETPEQQPQEPSKEAFVNKAGVMHWQKLRTAPAQAGDTERYQLIEQINETLLKTVTGDLCILDDRKGQLTNTYLKRGKIPSPVEWTSKIPASRGDTISLTDILEEKDELVVGIYWKNGSNNVDLDLSTCGLDKDYKYDPNWKCDYTQLTGFNNTAHHSGDITNAPQGASEYIRFSLKELQNANPNLKYILVACLSFNAVPFEQMGEALVWVGRKNPDSKGNGPFDCHIIDACKLEGSAQVNMGAFLDLEKKELVFTNLNMGVGKKKKASNSISSREQVLSTNVENFIMWKTTKSCPPTWKFVGEKIASCCKKVIFKQDTKDLHFLRKENETEIEFYHRIQQLKCDEDNDIVENKDENLVWYYLGNGCSVQMPAHSYIVSTGTPSSVQDETVTHLTDPLKIFDLKEQTKS